MSEEKSEETQGMKMRPSYINQISLGNWLQIVAFAAALYGGYILIKAQGEENQEDIIANANALLAQELRIRQLENAVVRQDERFSSIMTLLGRIDAKVDRLDSTLDNHPWWPEPEAKP